MPQSSHASAIPVFAVQISVDNPAIAAIAERLSQAVEKSVQTELGKLAAAIRTTASEEPVPVPARSKPPVITPEGVDLHDEERAKVADLRTALLLGKVPENAGILIDSKTTAKLLNVSHRTLYRLLDEGAMPGPVKIGGNMKRWRLAEILEWVDSDCPPQKFWSYPTESGKRKKTGR
jgi:excisionase family DNA binding protein